MALSTLAHRARTAHLHGLLCPRQACRRLPSALTKGAEGGTHGAAAHSAVTHRTASAVYMFLCARPARWRRSALLAPATRSASLPRPRPLLFIRPISGSGALAVGSEIMRTTAWIAALYWPRGGGHARLERNDILHCCRLLRCSGHYENALYHSRRPLRRRSDVPLLRIFCAPVLRRVKRPPQAVLSFILRSHAHADAQGRIFPLCPPIVIA